MNCSKRAGFSLIEVTLAMGILSMSLLVLLALLPTGLGSLSDAANQNAKAQIVQELAGEALMLPFDAGSRDLSDWVANGPYYYDEAGTLLEGTNADVPDQRVRYRATLRRVATVYPGSTAAAGLTGNIATIAIEITSSGYAETESYVIQVPNTKG